MISGSKRALAAMLAAQALAAPALASSGEGGAAEEWTLEPFGRLQFDGGHVDAPDSTGRDPGWDAELRRARLGVQGKVPGGIGYKVEADFASTSVEFADAILTYKAGPVEFTLGQHNAFQGMEELTSSLHSTFIERAAFTDAFGFQRRLGVSATYARGIVLAQAGAFTDNVHESVGDNRSYDARLVLSPRVGKAQGHLGASVHYTDLGTPAPTVRYRQRPLVHPTSERFIDTRAISASAELGYGVEAAVISGPLHAAAEGFWQQVDRPGALADPTFFGGFAEVGYFLTPGDTRGYKIGRFDRVKPANPLGDGGFGSVQLTLRYDHLDLDDAGIVGGRQNGYLASLIWKPVDYVAFMANYARLSYDNAVHPTATGERSYSVDVIGVRAQVDF